MKSVSSIARSIILGSLFVLAVSMVPQEAEATTWRATVGGQSGDWEVSAFAYLPNEFWIQAGDSITWTFATDEPHTVTFLTPTTIRGAIGGAPASADGSSFDGSQNVNSGAMMPALPGQTYTVTFPAVGNFKLVCGLHENMTGTVHVLPLSETLPHNQAYYDSQADRQRANLFSTGSHLVDNERHDSPFSFTVIAGIGAVLSNAGGFQEVSVDRFLPATIVIRAGETVEWTTLDPLNHSVTFGFPVDPLPVRAPTPVVASGAVGVNANLDSDAARHAIIGSPTDDLHSGRMQVGLADRSTVALPDLPLTFTQFVQFPVPTTVTSMNSRFRVTFPNPGIYTYHCLYHDNLGMNGEVIVLPGSVQ